MKVMTTYHIVLLILSCAVKCTCFPPNTAGHCDWIMYCTKNWFWLIYAVHWCFTLFLLSLIFVGANRSKYPFLNQFEHLVYFVAVLQQESIVMTVSGSWFLIYVSHLHLSSNVFLFFCFEEESYLWRLWVEFVTSALILLENCIIWAIVTKISI